MLRNPTFERKLQLGLSPRVLQVDIDTIVFAGLSKPKGWRQRHKGLQRNDRLMIPRLPTTLLDVQWQNRHELAKKNRGSVVDPFDPTSVYNRHKRTNRIFKAILGIDPQNLERLWEENEGVFMIALEDDPAKQVKPPKRAFIGEILEELRSDIKLLVASPVASYVAEADKITESSISFTQFRPYGWELLWDAPPEANSLYVPDAIDINALQARFIIDKPGLTDDFTEPVHGGIPDRPLAIV